jgi:diguanylate cyclase (GGDEF)-like protein
LNLPDSHGIETFRRAQSAAPQVPIILLVAPKDDAVGIRLVREGAQDFFIKSKVGCVPLAHAMRNAMERHQLLTSARAMTDSLTGLANLWAFTAYAGRDRELAERLGRRLMVVLAEPNNLAEIAATFGEERRDLAMVQAADGLRSIIHPADVAARVSEGCFGVVILETDSESLEDAWARMHSISDAHRIRIGAAIFDPQRPVSLDALMEQGTADLTPAMMALPGQA